MNAKEARQTALDINTNKFNIQYSEIKKKIDNEVKEGNFECSFFSEILSDVKTKLIEEGFTFESEHYDQRDGTTIKITW
jgi:hypothetical protein